MSAQTWRGGALRSASGLLLATILVAFALVAALPAKALADDESSYPELTTTEAITVDFEGEGCYMTFTPAESGYYTFSLTSTASSELISMAYLYVQDSLSGSADSNHTVFVYAPCGETKTSSVVMFLNGGQTYYIVLTDENGGATSVTVSVSLVPHDITETGSYTSETLEDVYWVETCLVYTTTSTGAYSISVELSDQDCSWTAYAYNEEGVQETYCTSETSSMLLAGETTYYIILSLDCSSEENSLSFDFSIEEDEMTEITLDNAYTYMVTVSDSYAESEEILFFTATVDGTYTFSPTVDNEVGFAFVYLYDGGVNLLGVTSSTVANSFDLEQGDTVYLIFCSSTGYDPDYYGSTVTYMVSVTLYEEEASDDADDDSDDDATDDSDDDTTTDDSDDDSSDGDTSDEATDDSDDDTTTDDSDDDSSDGDTSDDATEDDSDDDATDGDTSDDDSDDDATEDDSSDDATDDSDDDATEDDSDDDATDDSSDDSSDDSTGGSTGLTGGSSGNAAGGSAGGNAAGGSSAAGDSAGGGGNAVGSEGFADTGDATGMIAVAVVLAAAAALAVAAASMRRRVVR